MYAEAVEQSVSYKPRKKEGFIKRFLRKYLNVSREESDQLVSNSVVKLSRESPSIDQPDRAIHFTIYSASGGRIVETRQYNRKTDRSVSGLYIITSDQNFGAEIDKIITMEALKS
jgi:hypothetical protein